MKYGKGIHMSNRTKRTLALIGGILLMLAGIAWFPITFSISGFLGSQPMISVILFAMGAWVIWRFARKSKNDTEGTD